MPWPKAMTAPAATAMAISAPATPSGRASDGPEGVEPDQALAFGGASLAKLDDLA